ncbi:MAG TPA: hypothetical protein VFC46_17635, partial [Humisphaera sp.]|nr:hypothetical protein [Humisphaera sp.]
ASAMPVAVESIVNGACTSQLSDYYKFTAKKGQRIILHCTALEADSRADVVLDLYDAAGNHLQSRHDPLRLDPTIDLNVADDGGYVVALHDYLYRGGPEFGYRLAITTRPWIDYIDPPFATPGVEGKHVIYGRNLPGSTSAGANGTDGRPLEKLAVTIKAPAEDAAPATDTMMRGADASIATFSYRFEGAGGMSNPVRLALVSGSRLTEEEPNDTAETAQQLTIPAQIIGRFYPRNDRDWYAFHATKGQKLWIEVTSQRLGLPTDPWLLVQMETPGERGKSATFKDVAEADDQTVRSQGDAARFRMPNADPALAFTAPADGSYRIQVRDLFGSGQAEPRFFYLLGVRAAQPDYRLVACYSPLDANDGNGSPSTAVVRKGASVQIDVLAFRREGFDGEIELSAENLPPGVTAAPAVIGPSVNVGHLVISAGPGAADWSGAIRVIGKAKIAGADVVRPAVVNEVLARPEQGSTFVPTRISRNFALSVRGDVPVAYTIDVGDGKIQRIPRGGKLQIPVKIVNGIGSQTPIQLTVSGLPQFLRLDMGRNFTAGSGKKLLDLSVDPTAIPGSYSFVFRGSATVPYTTDADVAKLADKDRSRIDDILQKATADYQAAQQASQRAEQSLQEARQKVATLSQQQSGQKQLADSADRKQKNVVQKLADAQTASDAAKAEFTKAQQGDDAKAAEKARKAADKAQAALDKAVAALSEQKKAVQTAADAVSKLIADTESAAKKVTTVEEESKTARQREADARDFSQQAQTARNRAGDRAQSVSDLGRERDMRIVICSLPVRVEVVANPFTFSTKHDSIEITAGGKAAEFGAALTRAYGFEGEVSFDVRMPSGSSGIRLSESNNKIAKGKTAAVLAVQAENNAPAGMVACTLRGRYQWNNRELEFETPLDVKVLPAAGK